MELYTKNLLFSLIYDKIRFDKICIFIQAAYLVLSGAQAKHKRLVVCSRKILARFDLHRAALR